MLLSRPSPYSDECLVGYLLRIAERNGFRHIGHLLHHAGLNWKNNRAPIHKILSGEFALTPLLITLGLPECHSKIASLHQSFKRVIDTPYLLVKHPKVCPDCLDELGYCRYEWSLLPTLACTKHKKMLVDMSTATGKRLGWYRQNLNRLDGEPCGIKPCSRLARPSAIQLSLYVESLLSDRRADSAAPVVLQDLSLRESLSLIHFVMHYQVRLMGDSFNPLGMLNNELGQCYQNVWTVLKDWPDGFYAMLSQYVDQPMSNEGQGGLNKHFRDLSERLHRQQENQGVARIKAEFDRYIEKYWPGVLEPERLTRIQLTSTTRNIISKKEAAKILDTRFERINKLVQQGRLVPVIFKGKAHYLRDQVEALANEISSNWTMSEACEALELTRYQLKQLLDAGVIPALQRPDSLNRDWIIDKAQCSLLVEELRRKARNVEPPSDAISMAGVQRKGYSIVQLVLAMQSGELKYGVSDENKYSNSLKQFISFKHNKTM